MEPTVGLEPTAFRLRDGCTTSRASLASSWGSRTRTSTTRVKAGRPAVSRTPIMSGPRAPTPLLQFGRLACPPSSPGPHRAVRVRIEGRPHHGPANGLGPASRTRCLLHPKQTGFRLPRPRFVPAPRLETGGINQRHQPAAGTFCCPLWSSQRSGPSDVRRSRARAAGVEDRSLLGRSHRRSRPSRYRLGGC